jgi:hypothetical protein
MTAPDTTPPPAADRDRLPRHTTPTWEVELLISGAAVFAMLQLPGWLDARILDLMPRFAPDQGAALLLVYFYMKSATIVLAVTFALHLTLRAHWIALVGMHSVYPDGVHWERLRMGPVRRAIGRKLDAGATATIEKADNRATTVFAFGVLMGMSLLLLGLAVLLIFAVTSVLTALTGYQVDAIYTFSAIFLVTFAPLWLAWAVDRWYGTRLRADGAARRALERVFGFYTRIGLLRGFSTSYLLASHGGDRRLHVLTMAVIFPVLALVLFGWSNLQAPERLGDYALFPQAAVDSARGVDTAHYNDQRDPTRSPAVPYVQSAVIDGPYARLVVPYEPSRDAAALRSGCAGSLSIADGDDRAAAVLDCLAALHPVSLDGKPLPSLRYDAASDPRTERPALQAMIDVRALAPGRHELRVARAPPLQGKDHKHDKAAAYTIPFWR